MPLAAVTSVNRSDGAPSTARQIVAEQTTLQRQRVRRRRRSRLADGLALGQHAPLREVHVEVAVVVVVEKRDAARQHLGEIELARHAVEVGEGETGLGGAIDEPVARRTRGGAFADSGGREVVPHAIAITAASALQAANFFTAPGHHLRDSR